MNTYFGLSSANNNNLNVQQSFETDSHREHLQLMNSYPMMPSGTTAHLQSYQATNDYFLSTSNSTSATFAMSVSNPMLYYPHPWMRPGRDNDDLWTTM